MITNVTDANLGRARDFLEQHLDTSLFLLGNLTTLGPRRDAGLNSGNFRMIEEDGRVIAVFCLSRRGNLLVQGGGRADLARPILHACEAEPITVEAVVGDWALAEATFQILRDERGLRPTFDSKEILYGRSLPATEAELGVAAGARPLTYDDFAAWERLNRQYLFEAGFPVQGSLEQRRVAFEEAARAGTSWGLFEGTELVSTAGFNARYADIGQIGGVFTLPARRGHGLAARVMQVLLRDAAERHKLERLILFTSEHNVAARRLYERLGFSERGHFALLFGQSERAAAP